MSWQIATSKRNDASYCQIRQVIHSEILNVFEYLRQNCNELPPSWAISLCQMLRLLVLDIYTRLQGLSIDPQEEQKCQHIIEEIFKVQHRAMMKRRNQVRNTSEIRRADAPSATMLEQYNHELMSIQKMLNDIQAFLSDEDDAILQTWLARSCDNLERHLGWAIAEFKQMSGD